MLEYLFIIFLVIFGIQLLYFIGIYAPLALKKPKESVGKKKTPVSIIVCAKNEEENLRKNLPYILSQDYPEFEIVLINDCSHDQTLEIMKKFRSETQIPVRIVDVEPNEQFWGSKKYALTLGIKAATHEHLLFCDADCRPVSDYWIHEMLAQFNKNKQLILGYGAYRKIKKSLLNKLIRFETAYSALQYLSYANIGLAYMGVGRNLAYTKSLFFSVNGFISHMAIRSGDDDLFVNQVANAKNTTIALTPNSHTVSEPKTSFYNWILQKRRHISTASHYKSVHKFLLGLFYFSQLFFLLLSVVLLSTLFQWEIVAAVIALRIAMSYVVIGFTLTKLNERDLRLISPILEFFLVLIQFFIFIKNLFSKPTHW